MKERLATVAGLLAALLGPAALRAQGTFEGVVTMHFSVTGGASGPAEMKYYQKGSSVRSEMSLGGQSTASIVNSGTGESIVLMPATKQYMVMNLKQMAAQMPAGPQRARDLSTMSVKATGRRETIAGVPCEHYLFSDAANPGGPIDICGAAGMGFMGGGNGMSTLSTASIASATNPQLAALARRGFFPLKMTMSAPPGGSVSTWEVTRIERRALDTSLFTPPAGYTKITMPAMPGMPGMPKH